MKAEIEWLSEKIGVLRGGSAFDKFGDPYEFSCTIVRSGPLCEIKGLAGKLSIRAAKAIAKALENDGIFDAQWERKRNGSTIFKGHHI